MTSHPPLGSEARPPLLAVLFFFWLRSLSLVPATETSCVQIFFLVVLLAVSFYRTQNSVLVI